MTKAKQSIHIIGINASGVNCLSSYTKNIVLSAEVIGAPSRILKSIPEWWGEQNMTSPIPHLMPTDNTKKLIEFLEADNRKIVVLASGDPLWFGIGRLLSEKFKKERLFFHPSPTSFQLAFSRLGRSWQDATWISLHGRDPSELNQLLQKRPPALAVLTDPNRGGAIEVKQFLKASELEELYEFWIFEQLGAINEKITRIYPEDEISNSLDPLNLVLLIKKDPKKIHPKALPLFGIEDGLFIHYPDRPGLMTKREIRVQLLADLNLPEHGVIWDIGSGIGSIGLEALRIRPQLKLLTLEKRAGCKELIKKNAIRLSVNPLAIIEAEAINFLTQGSIPSELENPDRVILGGGGRDRCSLLQNILPRLSENGIVVIPLSTIEAVNEIVNILKNANNLSKVSFHQAYRGIPLGEGTRLAPMNPVFIVKGEII